MSHRKKKYDDDDGRVIANMNVEGMPWYVPGHAESLSGEEKDSEGQREEYKNSADKLTKKEAFWLYVGAMKAGCLVALIASIIVGLAGLIAFMVLGGFAK